MAAQVIKPFQRVYDAEPKYMLSIYPENPYVYEEIERRSNALREANYRQLENTFNPDGSRWIERFESRVVDGCKVYVESLFKPSLKEEFADYQSDDQLYGKFVQSVGHLYIHESGIVCLSSHILEPATHPNQEFEPYD